MPGRTPGVQERCRRSDSAMTSLNWWCRLQGLDERFSGLQDAALRWMSGPKTLSRDAVQALAGDLGGPATQRTLALQALLNQRHHEAFRAWGWHGTTSLQRVVWQDADTLALLAEPANVAMLMCTPSACFDIGTQTERPAESSWSLSATLLGGLAHMRPSYLLTTCPNWKLRPPSPGCPLDRLSDMRVPYRVQAKPWLMHGGVLDAAERALACFEAVLASAGNAAPGRPPALGDRAGLQTWIHQASSQSLLTGLTRWLTPERAARLMGGRASTRLRRMIGQCLEVMQYAEPLLALHEGSHERVLGYGLVSHALDARHLLAALTLVGPTGGAFPVRCRRVRVDRAARALIGWLDAAACDDMAPPAAALMRVRLQQVMGQVANAHEALGMSASAHRQDLAAFCL